MKKLLIIISVFAICFSFAVPVSADTENVFVIEYTAEWFLNKFPDYGYISEDGYFTVSSNYSNTNGNPYVARMTGSSETGMLKGHTYFYVIDGDLIICHFLPNCIYLKPNENYTPSQNVALGCKLQVGYKVKSIKFYEVVEAGFGHGGLVGNSSDIHYGVEVITDVFSKLWNVLINYWWVMVGLCLPISFYLLCILSDVFRKVPKGRFKPKLFSTGYYSGKKAYSRNSPTFDINYNTLENRRRKNRKGSRSYNNVREVFIVDGCTYYNRNKNTYTRRKSVNVDVEVDD